MQEKQTSHTNTKSIKSSLFYKFFQQKLVKVVLAFLAFLLFLAFFSNFIANDRPFYCQINQQTYYPLFEPGKIAPLYDVSNDKWKEMKFNQVDWREQPLDLAIWPLIAYNPYRSDKYNLKSKSPFSKQLYRNANNEMVSTGLGFRHWLGTNRKGQDLLSGLIHGTKVSLQVGFFSILIAGLIGILLGSIAGFMGDNGLKLSIGTSIMGFIGIIMGGFYGFYLRRFAITDAFESLGFNLIATLGIGLLIFLLFVGGFGYLGKLLSKKVNTLGKQMEIPLDLVITKAIEVLNSLPTLLLLIAFAALVDNVTNFAFLILIIGLLGWTGIARLVRAELLSVKETSYIESARAMGYSKQRIIFRHALPNSLAPIWIALAFGIASAIIAESTLSFLNIGVPEQVVSWGKLLRGARTETRSWWLALFPGIAIFLTVVSFNFLGERLRDVLDPKTLKQEK